MIQEVIFLHLLYKSECSAVGDAVLLNHHHWLVVIMEKNVDVLKCIDSSNSSDPQG